MNTLKKTFLLRPSQRLLLWLVMIHGGMAILLPMLPIPWWSCIALAVIIMAHFLYSLRRYVSLKHPQSIIELSQLAQNQWLLKTRNQQEHSAVLQGDSFVQPYLIVLVFKKTSNNRCLSVTVFPDSLPPADFRHLRILLLQNKKLK